MTKSRKAQILGMPFTMIMSIIVIAFILYVGVITVKGFLENAERIKVASFATTFKYDVNTLWQTTAGSRSYSYDLSAKIEKVCFANLSKSLSPESRNLTQVFSDLKKIQGAGQSNMFLYPINFPTGLGVPASYRIDCGETTKVNCLDLSQLPNPYCIQTSKGTVKIDLVKEGRYVRVVKK